MKKFFLKNESWFVYGFGLFFGYAGGSKGDYLAALAYASFVIIILMAIKWILVGPPLFRRKKEIKK